MPKHQHLIGLTGGIGSGKSTVASMLSEWGAHVLDADRIARALTEPGGAAIDPICQTFGPEVITAGGALDREAMRSTVFSKPESRRVLEAIIHPLIGEAMGQARDRLPSGVIVFDIPLLVESGRWQPQLDAVVVVDCSATTQIERVMQRSGWSTDMVQATMRAQASRSARLAAADVVIDNEGCSLMALKETVHSMRHWLGL
jgi:dephospho-CoA kinase